MAEARPDMADQRFAENLRFARERAGLSQAALATQMVDLGWPFHQQTIARIEDGRRKVGMGEGDALARAVGSNMLAMIRPHGHARVAWTIISAVRDVRETHRQATQVLCRFNAEFERLERAIASARDAGLEEILADEIALGQLALELDIATAVKQAEDLS
jgi:transcriptional regulator with XRE-family HTH domain